MPPTQHSCFKNVFWRERAREREQASASDRDERRVGETERE